MSLEVHAHYNDISPKLREKLEERIKSFGKTVRYKFDLAKPNPDPSKHNGEYVYPNMYTLGPAKFTIMDNLENRTGKNKIKHIALVSEIDEKGVPNKFKKIRVSGSEKGILRLEVGSNADDMYMAMFLELHPKLKGGDFSDPNSFQVFSRIDENAAATTERKERTAKLQALNIAQGMSDKEVIDFADAMMWDSSFDIPILRNQLEELAEKNPVYFNDLVSSKKIEYQATIKQAMNKGLIAFDPGEYKFMYAGNSQPIAVLSPGVDKTEVEKFAEWFMAGGDNAEKAYKKIKSLLKPEKAAAQA